MKNTRYIKGALLQVAFFTTVLLIASCTNNQKQQDAKEVAEERNDEKFDDRKQQKDAQFLVNAAEINLEKIQLGKLAQQKGSTAHVKELGKKMEDAHTKSQRDLTALAKSKGISIPNSPTENSRDAYTKLDKKSGKDFDKAYADLMVDKHEGAIEKFEKAATDCEDADIKNWAIATLPDLRTHLKHSKECQKKADKV